MLPCEVLSEIMGAQEVLAESIDSSFVAPLEKLSREELPKVGKESM